MDYFLTGFGLLAQVFLWGAGLAWLLTPVRWRSCWPLFSAPCGIVLQSSVVWIGAYANMPGTNAYAAWTQLLPVALGLYVWRNSDERRRAKRVLGRYLGLGAAVVMVLSFLLIILDDTARELTTASLGSCDAADYAAGARVLQEFARSDRTGFMGLTEVVRVLSVDNFFDYWLRLNHFTPSAVVALNGAIFGLRPHELIGATTAAFAVLTMPLGFWVARAGLRFPPGAAVAVATLLGLSPLAWYGVFHVAMAQFLAAVAIALLTGIGLILWREGAGWRRGWVWAGLLTVAYALLLGAYNFMLIVAPAPVALGVGGLAAWRGEWARLGRWTAAMVAPLAVAAGIFWERIAGLAERFLLFRQYDFGWKIPALTPEGWFGMVADTDLGAFAGPWRWVLAAAVVVAMAAALVRLLRRCAREAYVMIALLLPVAAGYAFLIWRGTRFGTNASYDAYKLLAAFHPVVLSAACGWLKYDRRSSWFVRALTLALLALVLGFNAASLRRFEKRMRNPPLVVDRALAGVQSIERRPEVTSVNLLLPDPWTRLWANAFMLRKPHYFPAHTYEGRLNTELKGEWDLTGRLLTALGRDEMESEVFEPGSAFGLIDWRSPRAFRASFDAGWFEQETWSRRSLCWRWTRGDAALRLKNPQPHPLTLRLALRARSLVPRKLWLELDGRRLSEEAAQVGVELGEAVFAPFTLPPGESLLWLRSDTPALSPGGADDRPLGFAAYAIEIRALAAPVPSEVQ